MTSVRPGRLLAAALGALLVAPPGAVAVVPGGNGRIAFGTFGERIIAMAPDGTGATFLTDGSDPAWASDGRRLALRRLDGDIHVVDVTGTSAVLNLTADGSATSDAQPAWSPDNSQVAFVRDGDIYTVDAKGGKAPVARIADPTVDESDPAWSPDGTRIAFTRSVGDDSEIYVTSFGAAPVRIVGSFGSDSTPAWSPDGASIAFTSTRDGNAEVYIARADGTGQRNLTRTVADDEGRPAWSPDGARVAFDSDREEARQIFTAGLDGTQLRLLAFPENSIDADWAVGAGPTAALAMLPSSPLTGEPVTFDAGGSRDPDGSIALYEWDLDGDGRFEVGPSSAATTSTAYAAAGPRAIRVRVVDHEQNAAEAAATLTVGNWRPSASFRVFPNPGFAGRRVSFDASPSNDRDGRIARYSWDLDGHPGFETISGAKPTVSRVFRRAGKFEVRLRATDDLGADSEDTTDSSQTVVIRSRVILARSKLVFRNVDNGIRVTRLVLRDVPRGARVDVSCKRKGARACRRQVLIARSRTVSPRRLRGRRLRVGAAIEVRITKPFYVGRYFRHEIAAGRLKKIQRCMNPGEPRPRRRCS